MNVSALLSPTEAFRAAIQDSQLARELTKRRLRGYKPAEREKLFESTFIEELNKLATARVERGELEPFDQGVV